MEPEEEAELDQWLGPKSEWDDGQRELYHDLPWIGRRFIDMMRLFPFIGRWMVRAVADRAERKKSERDR